MSLADWNKNNILKFSIDYALVDDVLIDFPVLLNLSNGSGQNNYNCSSVFEHLTEGFGNDSNTTLLIHSNTISGSTTFLDSSASQHIVIANDTAKHSDIQAKFDDTSMYFDGGDSCYLSITHDITLSMEDYDFTLDFWMWPDSITRTGTLYYKSSGEHEFSLVQQNGTIICSISSTGSSWDIASAYLLCSTVEAGVWQHFAMTRNGSTWTTYLNGVITDTFTNSAGVYNEAGSLIIAGHHTIVSEFKGYLDEIRFSKGTVRWTTNFTPPNSPYTDVIKNNKKIAIVYPSVQEHWVENYDTHTVLIIHSNSYEGSTSFTDDSKYSHTITTNGDTHHKEDQSKFGNTAIYFDGSLDTISMVADSSVNFGTEDFTIDFWLNPDSTSENHLLIGIITGEFFIGRRTNTIGIGRSNVAWDQEYTANFTNTTWNHVAVVRESEVITIYVNGTSVGSAANTTNYFITTGNTMYIGGITSYYLDGYMDEIRISKGIARWTENFTPPTTAYEKENTLISYIHGEQEQLFCEIESWDTTVSGSENAQLWAKVPKVLSDQPTDLFLYYDNTQEDNTGYTGNTGVWAAQQVWNDNFITVYHMAQDPSITAPQILDSTSNNIDGTSSGSMTTSNLVDGIPGKGIIFDGLDDKITATPSTTANFGTNDFTIQVSFKGSSTQLETYPMLITSEVGALGTGSLFLADGITSNYLGWTIGSTRILNAGQLVTDDIWHDCSLVKVSGTYNIFLDGVSVSTTTNATGVDLSSITLGDSAYSAATTAAEIISKVCISDISRSDAWLETDYYSNKDSLITISQADIYQTSGYVKEMGVPVERVVCIYDRVSGELMDKATSNSLGYYTLKTTISGSHNLICMDADASPDYDDLIISKVTPVETI